MKKTGAEIIWECLEKEGVTTAFGYPGGAILPTYDAIWKYPNIHHVLTRHEQGATHMADGYARASGKVGVAIATSGPGATNMVTGIATAMLDSSPIVCITGQVHSKLIGLDAFQEIDITGITLPITKHNSLVTRTEDIARTMREAFYIARSGRPGPVLVDITKDAQQGSCEFDWESATPQLPGYRPPLHCDPTDLARAAELINTAKRPVILAGQGILFSGAMNEVRQLAERANIPVAITLLGIGGFPATHPLNLGMMGMHGEAWVNHAIQDADLILAMGMRFDDRVTGNPANYAPKAKKIHIELDRAEIGKIIKVDVPLVGDLREVLEALLPSVELGDRSEWLSQIHELKGDSAVRDIQNLPDAGKLYAAHAIHDLWRETHGQSIVVTDVGQHQMWSAQYYKHSDHVGGPWHDGFWTSRRDRREVRTTRFGGLGYRRGRRFPDDELRVGDDRAGKSGREDRRHQQRLSRHGPPVAGVLLRPPLQCHAAGQPGFREAGGSPRHQGYQRQQSFAGCAGGSRSA
jgi:acetolactate synthase I/II/III large subunit